MAAAAAISIDRSIDRQTGGWLKNLTQSADSMIDGSPLRSLFLAGWLGVGGVLILAWLDISARPCRVRGARAGKLQTSDPIPPKAPNQ